MKCPNCQNENQPSNQFCIFCGTKLPAAPAPIPQPPLIDADEIRQLRELLRQIDKRLTALEQGTLATAEPLPETEPAVSQAEQPAREAIPLPVTEVWEPTPAIITPSPKPPPPPKPKRAPGEWEQVLGGNWLARIGALALLIGVGFFLNYAFDRNWINEVGRIILGGVAGLAMLGGGYLWRKKYPIMTQVLTGAGIGVLYLAIFAAFSAYNLIAFIPAAILVLMVSASSVFFALRYNSMALVILGIIGAFLAPFMLGFTGEGPPRPLEVPIYLVIVDIGVLAVSSLRNWRWFTLLALVFSLIIFGTAYGIYSDEISVALGETFLTILFLIFTGATVLFNVIWKKPAAGFDYALMVINATAYFGFSYLILGNDFRSWLGGFALMVALFYGSLAYVIFKRGIENLQLSLFTLIIGLIFLTIAIPVQLGDRAWATVGWAAQGTALVWLSTRFRVPHYRFFGYGVFTLMACRLLFFDTFTVSGSYTPVFNERGIAFIFGIIACYLAAYLLWRKKDSLFSSEQVAISPVFLSAANVLIMWFIGAEVIGYMASNMSPSAGQPLAALIIPAIAAAFYPLFWRRAPQIFDIILLLINAVFYAIIVAVLVSEYSDWIGSLYFVLAIIYLGLAYASVRRGLEYIRLAIFALCTGLIFFTAAIPVQLGDKVWTTIAWAAELVALLWLASRTKIPYFRYFGYGVFVLLAGRLLFFDTTVNLQTLRPFINERFLAYLVGIAATYLGTYLLWRDRATLAEWRTPASTFLITANFLTLWVLSFELWQLFDTRALNSVKSTGLRNAQNLSLTALWLVYAVVILIVGIIKRTWAVRIGALALIGVVILKVVFYDTWMLETLYKIVAYVGLGVLLLLGSYLYQRNRERIREFLAKQ